MWDAYLQAKCHGRLESDSGKHNGFYDDCCKPFCRSEVSLYQLDRALQHIQRRRGKLSCVELNATQRMQHGLSYDATYTYAVNTADNQGDAPSAFAGEVNYGLPIADRFNIKEALGNVEGTRRNRFLLTGIYQLPFGKGRAWMNSGGVKDVLLGSWDLDDGNVA